MTRRPFLFFFLAAFLYAGSAQAGGLVLKFHADQKTTKGAAAPVLSQKDYTVTLYPDVVDVQTGNDERVYDPKLRQLYSANTGTHKLITYSLYAIPVSRFLDKQARLHAMFDRQKASNPSLTPGDVNDVGIDMLFGSQQDSKTSGLIQSSQSADTITFAAGGKTLAAFSVSSTQLPNELKSSYAHFLLYETTMHPFIQQMVSSADKVFRTLNYNTLDGDETIEVTLTLVSADTTIATAPQLGEFKPHLMEDDAMDASILNVAGTPLPTARQFEDKITGLSQQKQYLRAALAAKEMELILGPGAIQASAVAQQALQSKDTVTSLTLGAAGTEPHTTMEFLNHMALLTQGAQAAGDSAYLVEVFRADQMLGILLTRQRSPAEENALTSALGKLGAAITVNPRLTGAYCELGNAYFALHNTRSAWLMWDQAKRINPQYPGLQRAASLQAQAEKDFPEYF